MGWPNRSKLSCYYGNNNIYIYVGNVDGKGSVARSYVRPFPYEGYGHMTKGLKADITSYEVTYQIYVANAIIILYGFRQENGFRFDTLYVQNVVNVVDIYGEVILLSHVKLIDDGTPHIILAI